MLQVLHNPRCGKSRNCLAYLKESNKEFEVLPYLETPPTVEELKILLKKLKVSPLELVRQKEALWIANYKSKSLTEEEIIKALSEHPILIERPIVIDGENAVIGRELDKLERFL
ncbi:MAG: putative protein YfgD [Bacteroidota bacterium]|jgi:arsenate reductase